MSRKELEEQLRTLRKTTKPVSKMKVTDISAEIERLKLKEETTPAVASYPSSPHVPRESIETDIHEVRSSKSVSTRPKKSKAVVEAKPKPPAVKAPKQAPAAKGLSKKALLALLSEVSDSE
jgi:hypothetical protein